MQTKTPSNFVVVGKAIRAALTAIGVSASVKGSQFALGDNVKVVTMDLSPKVFDEVENLCNQYMHPCYGEYMGTDKKPQLNDLPKVKFVHVRNGYSVDMQQKGYDFLKKMQPANFAGLPDDFIDACHLVTQDGQKLMQAVESVLKPSPHEAPVWDFWADYANTAKAAA